MLRGYQQARYDRAMAQAPNPYAPPRDELAIDPSASTGEAPPQGRYRLEPFDVSASIRARSGRSGVISLGVIGVLLLGIAAWHATAGDFEKSLRPGVFGVVMILLVLFVPWSIARAVERKPEAQRSLRVTLDASAITFDDEAGNSTRLAWTSFAGRRVTRDHVFLELPSRISYSLPRRAWRADDFAAVQAFVEARVPLAKRGFRPMRLVLLWVLLILMFVAVWNFFSDVPRQPQPQGPSSAQPPR